MEQILEMVTTYGLETVVIALLVNLLTGLVKMPIKAWANKLKDYTKVTRFIVFLPIGFGFLLSFLYAKFMAGGFKFDQTFVSLWLTSSSLSLMFYAIFEKLFPSKKKALTDCEIKTSESILENIKQLVEKVLPSEKVEEEKNELEKIEVQNEVKQEKVVANKIVLRGKQTDVVGIKK